jgi:nucleoside-diphosphate-sugar epimerase
VAHFRRQATGVELGNLDVWRDFGDVRSVVQAYRGLLEARPLGQTINVCSGKAFSLREVIGMCASITGQAMAVSVNPAFVRANEVKTLCGDASLLRSLLGGWHGMPLEQTLSWMLESEQ